MFVLKGRWKKMGECTCQSSYQNNIKRLFNGVNYKSNFFENANGNKNEEKKKLFSFSKEMFNNVENVNIKKLTNREMLYFLGYCSKNKLLNLTSVDCIMKELKRKVTSSIDCISNDFSKNKKNILNKKCYHVEEKEEKPFFDIHDLVKVYLNVCYINSAFFLKIKRETYKQEVSLEKRKSTSIEEKPIQTWRSENEKAQMTPLSEGEVVRVEKRIMGKVTNSGGNEERRNIIIHFEKDQFIYTNEEKNNYKLSEYVCNEQVKNIFYILSIFFLQNINILNNHYLCRLFYGYNKSKFYSERYFNNLCFQIIKRIKKIRTYHLYLMLINSYYLPHIDVIFVKIIIVNIVSKLSQLPCEAICKIIPIIPLFTRSEKINFKINVIYAKKIATFNQVIHLIILFKKMIQQKIISQKNIFVTFKYLNNFMKIKKHILKKSSLKKTILTGKTKREENTKNDTPFVDIPSRGQDMINNVIEQFDTFDFQNGNEEKNKVNKICNSVSSLQGEIFHAGKSHCNTHNNNSVHLNRGDSTYTGGHTCVMNEEKAEIIDANEDTLMRKEKNEAGGGDCQNIYQKDDLFFHLKVIEMHLRHDFKSIYCLLPNEYKTFLQNVRDVSCTIHKNMQGEKEIYILKKYMKMLNYNFITFIYGPYVLHICDPFYKIYLEWKHVWKLYPPYEQNKKKNFHFNKNNHLKKEGFTEILICHDSFTKCQSEKEKLKYISSILENTAFSKCFSQINNKKEMSVPLSPRDIYL
ncbi:conserved Plasmodium protein, unknown function [Plasmodium ovale wallikeri]|uniref:Uncharacterized protein n=1 Tax=Plasmodium ovale wallikeri TaxID=864142 RepID=A0A1A8ZY12_PLAOA|nr:conserved Plasmodium protein, unknown function [Plasmodium ovale wallikeri]SBT48820.1 conserved Plasmodium protein, unknown function [Plasmodium ovale wallikeri]